MPVPAAAAELFDALFTLSLAGSVLYDPVRDEAGDVVDFTFARLNPAAQQLLALPAVVAATYLQQFPEARANGAFACHQAAFASAAPRYFEVGYPAAEGGPPGQLRLQGQRVGEQLLVSFADARERPWAATEAALRASEAREQTARAEAQRQRLHLHQMLMQLPTNVAMFHGPDHTYELLNERYQQLFPTRALLGLSVREVLPEAAGQGFEAVIRQVYQSGQPAYLPEAETWADFAGTGQLEQRYYNASFHPLRDAQGRVTDVLNVAFDITEQVRTRQQLEQLNQELEARVRQRTHEAQAAQAEAERQQQELRRIFEQAPVAIAVLQGPRHLVELANDSQLAIWGRTREQVLGQELFAVLPEAAGQGFEQHLDEVLATGRPFVGTDLPARLIRQGKAEQLFVSLVYTPLRRADDQITGVVMVVTDTTEQVLARRQADTMQAAMLGAAQRRVQQREDLYQVFEQTPAAVALLRGPAHRFEYVNPAYQRFFPGQRLPGRSLAEAHPAATASGITAHLDRVFETGQTYRGTELPVELTLQPDGPSQTHYFNFTYQAYREQGHIVGVSIVAYEVTEPVLARRATAQQAERQQQELRRIFEQAPVAITVLRGPELVIELANAAICAIWGRLAAQLLGRPYFEAVPDTAGQGFEAILAGVLATGQSFFLNEAPVALDRAHTGRPATGNFNLEFQALLDEYDRPVGIIAIGTEVTEQVLARRAVEQLNQELEGRVQQRTRELQAAQAATERQRGELERVFEQAPVAIAVYRGSTYTIELANPTVARLWGRSQDQLIGKALFEALPEVAGQGFEQLLDGVMATGVPYVAHGREARHERNGQLETVYWDFVYVPTYAASGVIDGAMVVATDATAQVLASRQVQQLNEQLETRVRERTHQLSEQQALLRQILGQVPAFIATLSGPEHRFSFFNESYQELTSGRTRLGLTVAEVAPEAKEQGFLALLDQVYRTGEPYVGTDTPVWVADLHGGARHYYIDFVYQPLTDGQQQVQGILCFGIDVTDRMLARRQVERSQQQVLTLNEELAAINEELRATNEELHSSNGRLLRTNDDLDTFVYTASHDLKAPITNLEGLLDALRDYLPTDGAEPMIPRLLSLMDGSIARFLQTIGQLTEVSRLQNAAQETAEPVDLARLAEHLRLDLAPLLRGTHGELLVDVAPCPTVVFSPKNLRSILYNLVSNGFKYRHPDRDPMVRLRARHEPGYVVLEVQDNGLGLTAAQQAKLFQLFQRLHTHVEGTGVGLYMLKRIIDNAEGTIRVQSEPGLGTTFTVRLPRQ